MSYKRRDFFKTLGSLSISGGLLAETEKQSCVVESLEDFFSFPEGGLLFWADGFRGLSRMRLSLYVSFLEEAQEEMELAVLMNSFGQVLGFRRRSSLEPPSPYLVFEGLVLSNSPSDQYHVVLKTIKEGKEKLYRKTLLQEELRGKPPWKTAVPEEMVSDFAQEHEGRLFQSSFFHTGFWDEDFCQENLGAPSAPCFADYFPRFEVLSLAPGGAFHMRVRSSIPDEKRGSYLRYYFITDPVGRLLAVRKRVFGDKVTLGRVDLKNESLFYWKKRWGVEAQHVPRLDHCPFVRIFTEHPRLGLFEVHCWLR